MTAEELLTRAEVLGVSVQADGSELVLRYRGGLPADLVDELRAHKAEVLAFLVGDIDDSPVACRGCAAAIPAGTTLCVECGSARSPLVRYALELCMLSEERSLRGRTLSALDKVQYPKLRLRDGRTVGPGLLAWCPVLREGNSRTLRSILKLLQREGEGAAGDGATDTRR
jgi:TubC N-terminal docking domain